MPQASSQCQRSGFGTGLMIEDFQCDGTESLDGEEDPRHLIAAGLQPPEGLMLLAFILFSRVQHHLGVCNYILITVSAQTSSKTEKNGFKSFVISSCEPRVTDLTVSCCLRSHSVFNTSLASHPLKKVSQPSPCATPVTHISFHWV